MPSTRARDKLVYKGTVAFSVVVLQQTITFPAPMPDDQYLVYWATPAIAVNVTISSRTINGFTITLGLGLAMNMDWAAVENVN